MIRFHLRPGAYTLVIKSELIQCIGVQIVADAQRMPFADATLRAIVFANVLHHLPNVRSEARRCLEPGGKTAMIEPSRCPTLNTSHRYVLIFSYPSVASPALCSFESGLAAGVGQLSVCQPRPLAKAFYASNSM